MQELWDSPVWLHYHAHGVGCAAGPPPRRWWPRRCSGRRLRAGPCQAAGHGPRPPAVPKHREEPCDTTVPVGHHCPRGTPLYLAQPLGERANGHSWAHSLPTPAHRNRKLLGQRCQWPWDSSIRSCTGVRRPGWRGAGRQRRLQARCQKLLQPWEIKVIASTRPQNMRALGRALHGKAGSHQEKGIRGRCCSDYRTAQLIPPHRDEWLEPPHNQQITI